MNTTIGLYANDETQAKLDALCNQQQRNRSNMMQWLIDQEYRRQFGTSTIVLEPSQDGANETESQLR